MTKLVRVYFVRVRIGIPAYSEGVELSRDERGVQIIFRDGEVRFIEESCVERIENGQNVVHATAKP